MRCLEVSLYVTSIHMCCGHSGHKFIKPVDILAQEEMLYWFVGNKLNVHLSNVRKSELKETCIKLTVQNFISKEGCLDV